MIDAVSLIQKYLDDELTVGRASYTERSRAAWFPLYAQVSRHVAESARELFKPGDRSAAIMDDFEGDDVEEALGRLTRRTLYATVSWRHPSEGLVVTAFVDRPDTQSHRGPSLRMHLLMDREPPQFVALEAQCSTCKTTGKRGDATCEDCRGIGWTGYSGNLDLGPLVQVGQAKLHVPRASISERDLPVLTALGL